MKKVLMIIGGIVVGIIVLVATIFIIISATSKKLVCKSSKGDITIMYNDKTLTGYIANGVSYDLEGQKAYAEQIGVDKYINEFSNFFKTNANGKCEK